MKLTKLKAVVKKVFVVIMSILLSLSVIFSSYGDARPTTRRREDTECCEGVIEPEEDK